MTLYADTPMWPRHGTMWGHLVSDTSLVELHDAARRIGLPPRSFDLDHYDWPEAMRGRIAAAGIGVVFVDNRELTRHLIASGLRIPLRERAAARAARSAEHARELGLSRVPRDLIVGLLGHVDPLPPPPAPGYFRLTRDEAGAPPRIEAHDDAGRRAAHALLARLDASVRGRGEAGFVGQVLDGPAG